MLSKSMSKRTRKLDYSILVKPPPISEGSQTTGVSVPFDNLEYVGDYVSFSQDYTQSLRFKQYLYESNFSSAYISRTTARFPGDFYASSMIYVWFDAPFYPDIKLASAASLPRGFIAVLTSPEFIKPDDFYKNVLYPFDRMFIGKPTNDVLAFQIVIQRDIASLTLYSFYIVIALFVSCEVFLLCRFKIDDLKDRLSIFVGLAIASVAFLWSIRQVNNAISWSESLLIVILGVWLVLEVKDAYNNMRRKEDFESIP